MDYMLCKENYICVNIMKWVIMFYILSIILCVILYFIGKFKSKHFNFYIVAFYVLHLIDITLLIFYDNNSIYLFLYIIETVSFVLVIRIIITFLKGKNIFQTNINFNPQGLGSLCVVYGIVLFPYEYVFMKGANGLVGALRKMIVIGLTVTMFAVIYFKLGDLVQYINEKELNDEIELNVVVDNMNMFELSQIYSLIKNDLFVTFMLFIFEKTIQIMNGVIVSRNGMKMFLGGVVVVFDEISVLLIACGFMYAYYLCKKEYKEKVANEEVEVNDGDDTEEIVVDVELQNIKKKKRNDDEEEEEEEEDDDDNDEYNRGTSVTKRGLVLDND